MNSRGPHDDEHFRQAILTRGYEGIVGPGPFGNGGWIITGMAGYGRSAAPRAQG
jgi:hypothetical protein